MAVCHREGFRDGSKKRRIRSDRAWNRRCQV